MRQHHVLLLLLLFVLLLTPEPLRAGLIVSASCPCGYHVEGMSLFGGRSNYTTVCRIPAVCGSGAELLLVNALALDSEMLPCSLDELMLYTDPEFASELMGEAPDKGANVVASWNLSSINRTFVLYDVGYYCPRCGKFTLRFHRVGFWD